MAISNTASRNTYTLDSVTTDFDITFDCVFDDNGDATELTVWLIDSEGNRTEVTKGYASDQYSTAYKTVTYLDATSHAGETLLISRATPRTQLMDFVNNGAYNLNQVEAMSDKLTRIVQEQDATIVDRIQTSEEFAEAAAESADNAYASEQKAHDWADKAPDVEVETGEYSAKHWASKASQSSGSAAVSAYDASVYAGQASSARGQSASYALESEGWANGEQSGVPVSSGSPYYHYNSKYWADVARQYATGGLHYIGVWTITSQTDYSGIGTPRALGDLYYCQGTACTIDGVTYTQGDFIVFNQDVDDGDTITTSMVDKIDNTESVTPDNTCTLENKTIPLGDNDITTTANKVIVSDADGNIGAGSVDASKIVSTDGTQTLTNKTIAYDDNTLTGVQPTLTAGTGIDITDTTISTKINTVTGGINAGLLQIRRCSGNITENTTTSVTFDTPFDNACISVMATCGQLGFGAPCVISVSDYSKTGFKVMQRNGSAAAMVINFLAIGY